jgi:hypothetical protein
MNQPSTLDIGMDVHKDTIAVAYVAKAHDAEVVDLGTRQADIRVNLDLWYPVPPMIRRPQPWEVYVSPTSRPARRRWWI